MNSILCFTFPALVGLEQQGVRSVGEAAEQLQQLAGGNPEDQMLLRHAQLQMMLLIFCSMSVGLKTKQAEVFHISQPFLWVQACTIAAAAVVFAFNTNGMPAIVSSNPNCKLPSQGKALFAITFASLYSSFSTAHMLTWNKACRSMCVTNHNLTVARQQHWCCWPLAILANAFIQLELLMD